MNLIQKLLGLLGHGQNEPAQYETPKAEPRFKDLGNPEAPPRKPAAFKTERPAEKPADAPRKPQAYATDDATRRNQDDYFLNPVTNPLLWPTLYGGTTPATADDKPADNHHTSSDFSKAADDAPGHSTTQDHGSSHDSGHSSSYDSGSSYSSSNSYDSGSSSSSFDSGGGGGGFDGGGGASFAPEWR